MPGQRGFTMLEIIIAMAIIGLLAMTAIPSYQRYLLQGKLSDGIGELVYLSTLLEKFYLDNRHYAASNGEDCAIGENHSNEYFAINCQLSDTQAQTYLLTATSLDNQISYSLDQQGSRRTLRFPEVGNKDQCWVKDNSGSCW